ncbi:MAG: hypothetical protein KAJ24_03785 [Candidatus Aenigmarchaeota archaeon]|nr:hypothetical protein [Candidatus Aenigmarchaeota archaeon]
MYMKKSKLREWFDRYAFTEFIALLIGLAFANIAMHLWNNIIIAAFLATWGDNIGFYGIIIYKDMKLRKKKDKKITFHGVLKVARNTIVEFGPAEYLDSFLLRPFHLASLPYLLSNYSLAIIIGTVLADITYYIPVITSYEFRKKVFRD